MLPIDSKSCIIKRNCIPCMETNGPDRHRTNKKISDVTGMGRRRLKIISTVSKRVTDYSGNENDLMLLCKHYLKAAKDFFQNIDNTIEERIRKGALNLINLCDRICCGMNSLFGLPGILQVNIIRGGK